MEKSSDYLSVRTHKKYATHANNFFHYFEESNPEKSIDSIDQMQKNAFDLIRKRTSDQTTNHPKKSKKRTSQNTQQLLSSESSDKKETSYSRRIESIKDLYRKANYWLYWFDKKYRKVWNAKAEAICKIKSTTDGVRQA